MSNLSHFEMPEIISQNNKNNEKNNFLWKQSVWNNLSKEDFCSFKKVSSLNKSMKKSCGHFQVIPVEAPVVDVSPLSVALTVGAAVDWADETTVVAAPIEVSEGEVIVAELGRSSCWCECSRKWISLWIYSKNNDLRKIIYLQKNMFNKSIITHLLHIEILEIIFQDTNENKNKTFKKTTCLKKYFKTTIKTMIKNFQEKQRAWNNL